MKKEKVKMLCCVKCPFCKQVVTAILKDKRIHCPACKASAEYTP